MSTPAPQSLLTRVEPSDPDLVRIRDLVYQVAGIFHPDNKLSTLFERCSRRMKALQLQSLREYFKRLARSSAQTELIALLNEITVGETCFFRNQPQLDALRQIVLPRILDAKARLSLRSLRIWSAGCSTGEEPYTLRMLLLEEAEGPLRDWDVHILATDLNEQSLAHARNAIYGSYSTRYLSSYFRHKYFLPVEDRLQVQPIAREGVAFRRLNLYDDSRMSCLRGLDAIFCCNVLIYFDLHSKRKVLKYFYDNLLPHGYLFMGHSESLFGVSDDFQLVHLPGATAYIKGPRRPMAKQGI